jgi:plasmid stabilization system protein ParE
MTRTLIVRPEAQLDIEDIALWYEEQKTGLGDRFSIKLKDLLQRIAENSLQFPEIDRRRTRRGLLNPFPYAVYFVTAGEIVSVIAVLHQHRRPDTWKQRLKR